MRHVFLGVDPRYLIDFSLQILYTTRYMVFEYLYRCDHAFIEGT